MIFRLATENKGGFIGILLLLFLITMTCYTLFFIPAQSRLHWNDPLYWSDNPKTAYPGWMNLILKPFNYQLPEHKIFYQKEGVINSINRANFNNENNTFSYQFNFNDFPSAFDIPYTITLGEIPPAIEVYVKRPDNLEFKIYSTSLESANNLQKISDGSDDDNHDATPDLKSKSTATGRIFSSSQEVKNSLAGYSYLFNFPIVGLQPEKVIFSQTH
jgi:peptide/nickel transport system permease protein